MMYKHLAVPSLMNRAHILLIIGNYYLIICDLKVRIFFKIHCCNWKSLILIWMGAASISFDIKFIFWYVLLKTMHNNGCLQILQTRLCYFKGLGFRTCLSYNIRVIPTCVYVRGMNLGCLIPSESLVDGNIFLILSLDVYIFILFELVESFAWALIIMFCSSTLRSWPYLHVYCSVDRRVCSCSFPNNYWH